MAAENMKILNIANTKFFDILATDKLSFPYSPDFPSIL